MKKISTTIFFLFSLLFAESALADAGSANKPTLGRSYVCNFGLYGVVTIDTRDPGASITIHGVRHAASDGSYFYQTKDGEIAIAFNPQMTVWTYLSADHPEGIADAHCKVHVNRK